MHPLVRVRSRAGDALGNLAQNREIGRPKYAMGFLSMGARIRPSETASRGVFFQPQYAKVEELNA